MKSILITGGTGSFGQAFTARLLRDNLAKRICIYSRGEHEQADMARKFGHDSRLRFFIGDVRDRYRLIRAATGCDHIAHAAALKRIEVGYYNPDEMVKTNVHGAMNVIDAAQWTQSKKVCFLSTDKAFQPVSPYGHSKALAEQIFLASNHTSGKRGPRFSVTRYGNVWGSRGSVVPRWRQMLEDGERILPISDPEVTRFYMTMNQAIDLVLLALETMPTQPLIPDLPAYRLGDLAIALNAPTVTVGLGEYEKLHESMDDKHCSKDARRMTVEELRAAL
jgi:UDP-N-acetylglucosamine 4,6-dehydratase